MMNSLTPKVEEIVPNKYKPVKNVNMAPQRNHHSALGASLALASAKPSAEADLK